MRIGIDFDNTIVCYDGIFHEVAVKRGLIPYDFPTDRESLRDHLNSTGLADDFTRLQGFVYGPGIEQATLWPDVKDFVARASSQGHFVCVISHKSVRPMLGPAYQLRDYARAFLQRSGLVGPGLIPPDSIYFEETQEAKANRVRALEVDLFIDDLAEFLTRPDFPDETLPVLFDPSGQGQTSVNPGLRVFTDWKAISQWLLSYSKPE